MSAHKLIFKENYEHQKKLFVKSLFPKLKAKYTLQTELRKIKTYIDIENWVTLYLTDIFENN